MIDGGGTDDPEFTLLAELVIDIAREVQLRASQATPVVPLTPTQGQIMRFVHANPGCSASDIADGSGLQRTNVSTALRDLRSRDYITSQRHDEDGRAIRIYATERADEILGTLRASWAGLVAHAWRRTDSANGGDQRAVAIDVLSRIRHGLGADRAMNGLRESSPSLPSPAPDSSKTDAVPAPPVAPEPSPN